MKKFKNILSVFLVCLIVISIVSCNAKNKTVEDNIYPENNEMSDQDLTPPTNPDSSESTDGFINFDKIIKTVKAEGQTKEYDSCVEKVKSAVKEYNGYIQSSNIHGVDYSSSRARRKASFVFRIPAKNLEDFKNRIASELNIISINEDSANVSTEYYDIKAIIETLNAERTGLLNILKSIDNSTQYDYWLKVTERLSQIEQQIAVYQARLNNMDNMISYSTFHLTISEVKEFTEPEPDSFGKRFSSAISQGWNSFADVCQNIFLSIVYLFPAIIFLAVIGAVIAAIVNISKKHKKKSADNKDDNSDSNKK